MKDAYNRLIRSAALAAASMVIACGGGNTPTPVTTTTTTIPAATPTLTAVAVSPASAVGGTAVQGTVTLSAAPTSAATVALASNNGAATVPANVTVNAGATTATFSITTAVVAASTPVSISAVFSGVTQSATLTLTPQPLAASFTVSSLSAVFRKLPSDNAPVQISPAGTADACPLVNQAFDCRFDGSASTPSASIQEYIWTYTFGPRVREERTATPQHKPTETTCNFFAGQQSSNSGGVQFINMRVDLKVKTTAGVESAVVTNQNVRIFPAGQCGYGF
jgi:hypothetical protein